MLAIEKFNSAHLYQLDDTHDVHYVKLFHKACSAMKLVVSMCYSGELPWKACFIDSGLLENRISVWFLREERGVTFFGETFQGFLKTEILESLPDSYSTAALGAALLEFVVKELANEGEHSVFHVGTTSVVLQDPLEILEDCTQAVLRVFEPTGKGVSCVKKVYLNTDPFVAVLQVITQVYPSFLLPKVSYYFTFGSSSEFPYRNGYLIVKAYNKSDAVSIFRSYFPDRTEGVVNCAFIYNQEEWEETTMGDLPYYPCYQVLEYEKAPNGKESI